MPSFAKIFSFAAVAFAAFASAAPARGGVHSGANAHVQERGIRGGANAHVQERGIRGGANAHVQERGIRGGANAHVQERGIRGGANAHVQERAPCGCAEPGVPSLPTIIADLTVDIKIYVDELTWIKKENCTAEVIKPIITGLCGKLADAAVKVSVLAKYDISRILVTVDGAIDIRELGHLISALVIIILNACGLILNLIGECTCEIMDLLCSVGIALSRFLHCIFGVVGGLLAELIVVLCADLTGVFWVIIKLNIIDLFAILKISVSL